MLVAFVQNDTSKQVLQCHSVALTEFSPLPVHAFFQVEDTLICRKDLIAFENFSTGDVENTYWFFEGGTPETSTELQPEVRYNETGVFDVRLVVNNSISLDTTFIEDYIHVRELPNIGFSALPDFCHNDPPYQLTEGWPEEGNYFGLFVDTGYFHPEVAGPGSYLIYFAYQDEESMCSDTLSQSTFVQLCNGVDELDELQRTFEYSWSGNQLNIEFKQSRPNSNTRLLIYNPIGQLLDQQSLSSLNHAFQWDCPPHIRCFILVLDRNGVKESLQLCR
jgi:PKD repeat protein